MWSPSVPLKSLRIHFRSEHHKISLAWLRFFSICLISFVVKLPNQLHCRMTWTSLATNFPTKVCVKFTTLFSSSILDCQLCNEIAKFIVNFRNFKLTSETICQKFCQMLWKKNNSKVILVGEYWPFLGQMWITCRNFVAQRSASCFTWLKVDDKQLGEGQLIASLVFFVWLETLFRAP